MVKQKYHVDIWERNRQDDTPIENVYTAESPKEVIDFFGLREPDVERYEIKRVKAGSGWRSDPETEYEEGFKPKQKEATIDVIREEFIKYMGVIPHPQAAEVFANRIKDRLNLEPGQYKLVHSTLMAMAWTAMMFVEKDIPSQAEWIALPFNDLAKGNTDVYIPKPSPSWDEWMNSQPSLKQLCRPKPMRE
jgi:hypothetical protein